MLVSYFHVFSLDRLGNSGLPFTYTSEVFYLNFDCVVFGNFVLEDVDVVDESVMY